MSFIKMLISMFLISSLGVIHADTIEVFTKHDTPINGSNEAKEKGHSVIIYYMDGVEFIQDKLAQRANKKLQSIIADLEKKEGLEKLVQMTEFERNQLLLNRLKRANINPQSLSQSLVTPNDREQIKKAFQDLIYAENHGVTEMMLPAVIFRGRLYQNVSTLSVLFHKRGKP